MNIVKMLLKRLAIIFISTPFTVATMICVAGVVLLLAALVLLGLPIAAMIASDYEIEKFYH
jgi:hypothetical protein